MTCKCAMNNIVQQIMTNFLIKDNNNELIKCHNFASFPPYIFIVPLVIIFLYDILLRGGLALAQRHALHVVIGVEWVGH